MIAWVFALLPGIFLIATFLSAASKNQYVIDLGNTLQSAYGNVVDTVDYVYDEVQEDVDYLNEAGANIYTSATNTFSRAGSSVNNLFNASDDPESISNAWLKAYGAARKANLDEGSSAVAATAVIGRVPPADTAAAIILSSIKSKVDNITISGEYLYVCGDSNSSPTTSLANQCQYVSQQCKGSPDPACRDKLIGVVGVPAVCLGKLATGGRAPSNSARDNCLACDTTLPAEELNTCRCTAMDNCPDKTVSAFADYDSAFNPA